jgi:hypothetical protein
MDTGWGLDVLMRASDALRMRIGKLVLLLGSENDGECAAAAAAIKRVLASEGLDLHDLAAYICAPRDYPWPPQSSRLDRTRKDSRPHRWTVDEVLADLEATLASGNGTD